MTLSTYDDWLELSAREKEEETYKWDAYERENIKFPLMAAGRFAFEAECKVLDITIGTFHGGEYLLHVTVPKDQIKGLPGNYESKFEGFRIVYLPHD